MSSAHNVGIVFQQQSILISCHDNHMEYSRKGDNLLSPICITTVIQWFMSYSKSQVRNVFVQQSP